MKKQSEIKVGKNVTLTIGAIEIVNGYTNRTKRNFSQTMDIIIKQWDKISIEFKKLKQDIEEQKKVEDLKKAKVIKQ